MTVGTRKACVAIIGAELLLGVAMLAGYQAWVRPSAPRNARAERTSPVPPPDLVREGVVALNAKNFGHALTHLRRARELQPNNPNLGYLLGLALEGTGEFGAAIDAHRSCTSGPYAQVAGNRVKLLLARLQNQHR